VTLTNLQTSHEERSISKRVSDVLTHLTSFLALVSCGWLAAAFAWDVLWGAADRLSLEQDVEIASPELVENLQETFDEDNSMSLERLRTVPEAADHSCTDLNEHTRVDQQKEQSWMA